MTVDKKLKYYAKKLNEDAPEGEFLAYINKKESNLLKRKGGLGIKTRSGIPSYIGSDASGQGGGASGGGPGDASDSGSDGSSSDGDNDRPTMADIAGPKTTSSPKGDDAKLEYLTGKYQTIDLTKTQKDKFNDYRKQMAYSISPSSNPRNRVLGGLLSMVTGIPGLGYGLGKAMDQTAMGYGLGTGPTTNNDTGDSGIMDLYSPNMMDISGEVVTEDGVTGGGMDASMSDFLQRFRGLNETRQDKLGQLDPQIIAMINKLYT